METSSHALDQARVKDVSFDVAVFTNLTRDHLDYHGTFDNYFAAKRHLFELLRDSAKATRGAVINGDDAYGQRLIAEIESLGLNNWSFGRAASCSVCVTSITETPGAMQIEVSLTQLNRNLTITAPFIGAHNAENVVAAFAACCALGYEPGWVAEAIRGVPQVPGRLERVGASAVRVFVDYAHTPDALERAIAALRPSTEGKLWVVFGCGGDRDKGKRPIMATVAASGADRVVVTSDNPRTEDPNRIISDVLSSGIAPWITEVDRRRAIVEAVHAASPGDTVLIAGKGHENYQIIGTEKSHFSDQEVAQEALGLTSSNRGWVA
jgi:UDP-N-acetylmuramoyl-L-alanyl-D-glutamate--2,6-diaminopimelate ligase